MKSTRKNVDAKLNNLKSRIQGRSQDLFRGSHNSPKAPNPVRHLPPPAPPMFPKVEVTVSLSVFTISKITSCVYFHVLRTTSHIKKISRRGRAGTAKKCSKKRAIKTCKKLFNFLKLLLLDVVLVAVAVVVSNKAPPSFTDVCKSLGIRMYFYMKACKMIRIPSMYN